MENYPFPDPEQREEWEEEDAAMEDWWLEQKEKCWDYIPHYYPLVGHLAVPMHQVVSFLAFLGDFLCVAKQASVHQEMRGFLNFLRLVDREEEAREILPHARCLTIAAWLILGVQGRCIE
ncbi:uncharacterized protein LOC107045572 [Diachasma alloeum]|uniref:uncharacterized protein LOC107045572 n=1 Tax=Diachasma alloeum TaxID=454923 RepID=UPI0007381997|nr:uncharacterized protein LOC107045572 [Diachasma alloeum]